MIDFNKLKKTISDIGTKTQTLREMIEAKIEERDFLQTAPLPREDFARNICNMLDKQAEVYPERMAQYLGGIINKPMFDFNNPYLDLVAASGGSIQPGTLPKVNALWFFGAVIKERITDAIMIMDYPQEVGPPLAERQPAIEKLNAEIEKLELQEAELREQAEAAGIHISRVDAKPNPGQYLGGTPLRSK